MATNANRKWQRRTKVMGTVQQMLFSNKNGLLSVFQLFETDFDTFIGT